MNSLWSDTAKLPVFEKIEEDKKTDVLIIGGGIAGILTAYFLHNSGVNYILVEKDKICSENTKNTTAKITYQHSLNYHKIAKLNGFEFAKEFLLANMAAFEMYALLCKNIECDYEIKDNYIYSLNNRYKLEEELNTLSRIGFKAELCENLSIPLKTAGAVRFSEQAQFHPLKFINAICSNLNIYENTFVRKIDGNTAITEKYKIEAKRIIVATHFPFINKHGMYPFKLFQHRSYVIALKNADNVNGMYADENGSGISFRNYNSILLLGGGGHRTGYDGGRWEELKSFAKANYPDSVLTNYWSAQDCMSLDHMPYIGQYSPSTPNLYVISGFNKWGMTGAMTAAMLLNDIICAKHNDFAEIFSPSRNILKPQLFINGFETAKNMLTITPKRCSHLGCALKWNAAEHSWDCPCHGSRFTENGKIINNPANKNLKIQPQKIITE